MAAARAGAFEIHADGSVTLAGETLAADEVEIQATPRPGTAVAHDDGLVAVIDTTLTPELRAEGDARELTRAVQDLRKEAELDLDDRIVLWVDGLGAEVEPYLASVARETLADELRREAPPAGSAGRDRPSRARRGADRPPPRRRMPEPMTTPDRRAPPTRGSRTDEADDAERPARLAAGNRRRRRGVARPSAAGCCSRGSRSWSSCWTS